MNSDLLVVARRWDGLGARLHAILNAWSIARALDLEFRFVWPRNAFRELIEPREIFDATFLDRFEIAPSICDGRVILPDPASLSLPDAKKLFSAASSNSMIEIAECFNVLAFASEPADAAAARFRCGLSEIGWSRASRDLIESLPEEKYPRGYSAIHVRAGDIVTGDWRQFVPVEKYMPTACVECAIETLSGPDRSPVVLVSDNEPYIRYLKARFNAIRLPGDMVAGYADLTEIQRALADILILSRARRIAGPRASAFSQLAAHLGGLTVLGVDNLMAEDDARRQLRDGIARAGKEAGRSEVLLPLWARDICWFLDVFSDSLTVGEKIILAQSAAQYEPDFCGALNRLAAALALAGHHRASIKASSAALRAAALSDRHADPLVESLATYISAKALAFALGAREQGRRRLLERLGVASIFRCFWGGCNRDAVLDDIRLSLKKCETLTPFQINHQEVLINLRFQIAALVGLATADCRLSEMAKATISNSDAEPLFLPPWRSSGFSKLRASGSFPQALRNLEFVSIRIARAIGIALSETSSRQPPSGNVDSITASSSGLCWITGWAYDADAGGTQHVIGYVCNDAVISAGVTFLARPDIAAALNDPRALQCGFAFPVPLAVSDNAGDLRSNIRVASL